MNIQSFIKTAEWQEIKSFFKGELLDKPLNIKLDGMSNDRIALEVRASQLAGEKIKKMISKFERMGGKEIVNKEGYI